MELSGGKKILERVRRLLALSRSDNVHEAPAAAKAAQRLMQEHKLSEADVEEGAGPGMASIAIGAEGFMAPWRFALAAEAARAFSCEAVGLRTGRRRKVRIVGRQEDAKAAAEVLEFLTREIDRLADHGWRSKLDEGGAAGNEEDDDFLGFFDDELDSLPEIWRQVGDARPWKEAFRKGAAAGAGRRLRERHRAESGEKALSVIGRSRTEVRAEIGRIHAEPRVVSKGISPEDGQEEAYAEGYRAGRQISLPGQKIIEPKGEG